MWDVALLKAVTFSPYYMNQEAGRHQHVRPSHVRNAASHFIRCWPCKRATNLNSQVFQGQGDFPPSDGRVGCRQWKHDVNSCYKPALMEPN